MMVLEKMCLPAKIMEMTAEEILLIWRKEVKRGVGIKKAQKLLEIAAESVGIREGLEIAEYEMKLLMKEYKEVREVIYEIEEKLENLVMTIPAADKLLEIKGIGVRTVAGFLQK